MAVVVVDVYNGQPDAQKDNNSNNISDIDAAHCVEPMSFHVQFQCLVIVLSYSVELSC